MKRVFHHWRWRSPRYLITCGMDRRNVVVEHREPVTCKNCLRVMKARGWLPKN